jgi:hypothetical protein
MYKYTGILLLLLGLNVSAQVSIIQHPLQPMQMKASDIFRADVLNSNSQTVRLYFIGTIVNTRNGQQVVSARTQPVDIAPGARQLSENLLVPQYTFGLGVVEQTGNLPYGNYEVCLRAYTEGSIEESATACEEVELMPLSPPLLISPEHESTITEDQPLLVWLPPMPVGKERITYDLKLVELLPNQTAYDAIQRNFAILEKQEISGTSLQYPANATRIEAGKQYAWKVAAFGAGRKPLGETEVWWFRKAAGDAVPVSPEATTNYVKLRKEVGSDFTHVVREIRVVYNREHEVSGVRFTIKPIDGKSAIELKPEQIRSAGDNKFIIDLSQNSRIKAGQFYILEAHYPQAAESQYLLFKYISK